MNFNRIRTNIIHNDIKTEQSINVFFDNLQKILIEYINKATYIIGCIAWMTNDDILHALREKKGIKIIVNKEDFLKGESDIGQKPFYCSMRAIYEELPNLSNAICPLCKPEKNNIKHLHECGHLSSIFHLSNVAKDDNAIMTFGIVNSFSKMHHKFLLFFDDKMNSMGIWTGSYNLSNNANNNLENAVYICDNKIFQKYLSEFALIYKYSEHYKWTCGYFHNGEKND